VAAPCRNHQDLLIFRMPIVHEPRIGIMGHVSWGRNAFLQNARTNSEDAALRFCILT
jgi:hypothetical protein